MKITEGTGRGAACELRGLRLQQPGHAVPSALARETRSPRNKFLKLGARDDQVSAGSTARGRGTPTGSALLAVNSLQVWVSQLNSLRRGSRFPLLGVVKLLLIAAPLAKTVPWCPFVPVPGVAQHPGGRWGHGADPIELPECPSQSLGMGRAPGGCFGRESPAPKPSRP